MTIDQDINDVAFSKLRIAGRTDSLPVMIYSQFKAGAATIVQLLGSAAKAYYDSL